MRPWAGELPGEWAADRPLRTVLLGHLYGNFALRNEAAPGPAATFLENLDALRGLEPDLVLSLGDLVYAFDPRCVEPTRAALERLDAPVLNVPATTTRRAPRRTSTLSARRGARSSWVRA
jgi:hypothetical protein